MTTNHIPRRSGVGMRQVLAPKVEKPKRRYGRPTATLCNAVHPDRPGIVDHETGEQLTDAVTCGRQLDFRRGQLVPHKGEHRARLLVGIVERWTGSEATR